MRRFLLDALTSWIKKRPPTPCRDELDPAVFRRLVRINRLEPLMDAALGESTSPRWEEVRKAFKHAHRACVAQTLRHVATAGAMADALALADIPCIGLRGPFADEELYRGEGRRAFTDLDLLIPVRSKRKSLPPLAALGYRFPDDALPPWFYARHHLHWPLRNRDTRIACDVHWALDHPYALLRIDYAAIFRDSTPVPTGTTACRRPAPLHTLLIQAVHLAKEAAAYAPADSELTFVDQVMEHGHLFKWLDLALMLTAYDTTMDWANLWHTACAWSIVPQLSAALRGCDALFPDVVSSAAREHIPAAPRIAHGRLPQHGMGRRTWLRTLGQRGGFRILRTTDALHFLWPPPAFFASIPPPWRSFARAGHTTMALMKLTRALTDGLICLLIVARRRWPRTPPPSAR